MLTLEVKGWDEVQRRLQAMAQAAPEGVAEGVWKVANDILTEADQLCPESPHGSGTLRRSGNVEALTSGDGRLIGARIGYGAQAEDYAVAVHEHLSEHSPYSWRVAVATGHGVRWSRPGSGPKFLERPLLAAMPTFVEHVASVVRERLARASQ